MSGKPLQPGFVLHRRDYRNNSLLLELFTLQDGRLPAIARGAKSGRGQRGLLLRPFAPLQFGLSGRGEIGTLGQAEPEGRAFDLRGKALYCGFYLNELLMRLLPRNDPHAHLFAHYISSLTELTAGQAFDGVLRTFEVNLLREIGYELMLDRDTCGAQVQPELRYDYLLEQGPQPVAGAGRGEHPLVHGRTLLGLHHGARLDRAGMQEAKYLMRRILALYLGDRPLKSRELFRGFVKPGG